MADKNKIIKTIKDGGSLAIYIGTAVLVKPIILKDNDARTPVGKACAKTTGVVISCGIANKASKFFGKMVDEVVDFIDDIRKPKNKDGDDNA